MNRPRLLDLFCGAGGAARGYMDAGFHVTGVDIKSQPRYIGDAFHQADALEFLAEHGREFDAIHASPPCQGYSIMNNLPWLRNRDYPFLILPTIELLEASGKPYVLENVMGARHGAKGLAKRGLEAHGLKAGWLCGAMFGLPFYRHRLFASNVFWLAPGHPKHGAGLVKPNRRKDRWVYGGETRGLPRQAAGLNITHFTESQEAALVAAGDDPRGLETWPGRREQRAGLTLHPNPVNTAWRENHDGVGSLAAWQQGSGAQANGVGVGHAKGWRLAAAAMGVDWEVKREELTQMVPPSFTRHVGQQLMLALRQG